MRPRRFSVWIAVLLLLSVSLSESAHAWDTDKRTIVTAAEYGLVIGTLAGLLTLPVSGSARSVFVGTSVGLYLGLLVGIYHNGHRHDPDNPLRFSGTEPDAWPVKPPQPPRAALELTYPVARF